jgi:hypothetical protein
VCEVSFVAISEVAADRKSMKLIQFISIFNSVKRAEIKLLDMLSVEGETRKPIVDSIHRSVQKYKITEKALGLWEGNNNTDPILTLRRGNSNNIKKKKKK